MKRVLPVAAAALLAVGLAALLTSTAAAGGGEVVLTTVSTDPALVTGGDALKYLWADNTLVIYTTDNGPMVCCGRLCPKARRAATCASA